MIRWRERVCLLPALLVLYASSQVATAFQPHVALRSPPPLPHTHTRGRGAATTMGLTTGRWYGHGVDACMTMKLVDVTLNSCKAELDATF